MSSLIASLGALSIAGILNLQHIRILVYSESAILAKSSAVRASYSLGIFFLHV